MPIDSTNLFVSLAILQNRGVARDKMLAASVGAALIPGLMGLVLPLVVARNEGRSGAGTGSGSDPGTLTAVPPVIGKTQADAETSLTESLLVPVVQSSFIVDSSDNPATEGIVVDQDPAADEYVQTGSKVTIIVSLGSPPSAPADDLELDTQIQKDVIALQVDIRDTKEKIEQAKTAIIAAIATKDAPAKLKTP